MSARNLVAKDKGGTSDPYVLIELGKEKKQRTKTIKKTLNPTFNESLTYDFDLIDDVNIHNCVCQLEVWDWDRWESNDFLGAVQIPLVDANE